MTLTACLNVFIGAGLGGVLRHLINILSVRLLGVAFPFGTFFINVTGSLLMGLVIGYFAFFGSAPQSVRLFIATGVLGGYTTFSTFSLDAGLLIESGQLGAATLYVAGSVVLSILGFFAGLWLMRWLL
jgi:fluoride exporter